jgi:RNA polymerase sigma-70 factor (ECF subfamily)
MVDHDPEPPSLETDPGAIADREDRAIVARIRAAGIGDRSAWAELLTRYQDRLFGVCVRMVHDRETAADLTQDAFVKILQGLDSWDGRSRLSTWMIRVTMNVCLSHLRAAKLRRHASLEGEIAASLIRGAGDNKSPITGGPLFASGREPQPGESVQHTEQRRQLLAGLAALDPDQRAIIVLRDVQGLDYDQIGAALGLPVGTVKSRLFRARLALRQLLDNPPESSR